MPRNLKLHFWILVVVAVHSKAHPDRFSSDLNVTTDLTQKGRQMYEEVNPKIQPDGSDVVSKTLKRAFTGIRTFAAQALATYNYYFPEIAFSRCVGKYVYHTYPDSSKTTIESTTRFFKTAIGMFVESFKTLLGIKAENQKNYQSIGSKISRISEDDMNAYRSELQQEPIEQYTDYPLAIRRNDLQDYFQVMWSHNRNTRSPRAIGVSDGDLNDVEMEEPPPEQPPSVFDFDKAVKQFFGLGGGEETMSLRDCMQFYTLDVFWRTLEIIVLKE